MTTKRIPYDYPGWSPQPGPLDLGVYDGDHVVVACELKLHDIDWGLYDLVKVVSLFRAAKPVGCGFPDHGWDASRVDEVRPWWVLRTRFTHSWDDRTASGEPEGVVRTHVCPQGRAPRVLWAAPERRFAARMEGFGPYGCDVGEVGELRVMSVRPVGDLVEVPEELRPTTRP